MKQEIIRMAVEVEKQAKFNCAVHRDNCRLKYLGTPFISSAPTKRILKYTAHIYSKYCK